MDVEGSAQEVKPGKMIPLFRVPAADGSQLGPWDYKQNKNLVLFFFHSTRCLPCRQLLKDLAKGYSEYPQLNTEVLGISEAAIEELRELGLPFPLLSDRHRCRRVARRKGDPRLAIVYRNPMPRVLPEWRL